MYGFAYAAALCGAVQLCAPPPAVVLNADEYRDKVYGCWLGKNIGGTLGAPFEGNRDTHDVTFYTNLKEGEPAANDDLDLQMLWLKALEERGVHIDAKVLGEYWLNYVPVDWNEYGIGKANMRLGFMPPVSGHYNNKQWRDSNGAWIRSEIWACLAPGCPDIAAKYAYEDSIVDHGGGEGVFAEIFTASVESAAFVEHDRDRLIEIGLSRIPPNCATARAIRSAIDAYRRGLSWRAAREEVVKASEDTGWFQAPRNVAFVVIGWLYGEGDFGKSICTAVNCGDDTDCTGATLGSILGIIRGYSGIPDEWKKPIGDKINTVAIGNFEPPATLAELTDRTVAMAHQVLLAHSAPVRIVPGAKTDLSRVAELRLYDNSGVQRFWSRSPYQVEYDFVHTRAVLDYVSDPEVRPGSAHTMKLTLWNRTPAALNLRVQWEVPEGWRVEPQAAGRVTLDAGASQTVEVRVSAPEGAEEVNRCLVKLTADGRPTVGVVPFTLICKK
ncbi:MAG: ADP-ribosylglycohydrolase family protein [Armatimonadota bacterium]